MGKRKREHRQAVVAGDKKPFRASPDKPKVSSIEELTREISASEKIMERIRKLKGEKEG